MHLNHDRIVMNGSASGTSQIVPSPRYPVMLVQWIFPRPNLLMQTCEKLRWAWKDAGDYDATAGLLLYTVQFKPIESTESTIVSADAAARVRLIELSHHRTEAGIGSTYTVGPGSGVSEWDPRGSREMPIEVFLSRAEGQYIQGNSSRGPP